MFRYQYSVSLLASILFAGCGGGSDKDVIALDPSPANPSRGFFGMDIADMNADGFPDIVAASAHNDGNNNFDYRINVFLQNPESPGTFNEPLQSPDVLSKSSTWELVAADISGNGRAEIIAQSVFHGGFRVFEQHPTNSGQLMPAIHYGPTSNVDGFVYSETMDVGDVNGDLFPDVVLTAGDNLVAYHQDASNPGTFLVGRVISSGQQAINVSDIDADELADVLTLQPKSEPLRTLLYVRQNSSHPGTFLQPMRFDFEFSIESVSAADVNGDGRLDIVASGGFGKDFSDFFTTFAVLFQGGTHTFAKVRGPNTGNDRIHSLHEVADLTGDGKLEILAAQRTAATSPNTIEIFGRRSNGSYARLQLLEIPADLAVWTPEIFALKLIDLNGDSQLDIAVSTHEIFVFFQRTGQQGVFQSATRIAGQR